MLPLPVTFSPQRMPARSSQTRTVTRSTTAVAALVTLSDEHRHGPSKAPPQPQPRRAIQCDNNLSAVPAPAPHVPVLVTTPSVLSAPEVVMLPVSMVSRRSHADRASRTPRMITPAEEVLPATRAACTKPLHWRTLHRGR